MDIIGPSYQLQTRKAAVQRSVNYMLRQVEPGNEKAGAYLEQVPGLALLKAVGPAIRGAWWTGSRAFVVAGATLYEVSSSWGLTSLGELSTDTGPVDFAQGLLQLVLVDGAGGYVLTLATNAFAKITDPDFYGSNRVSFLDGKFIFVRPDTQQFYWSSSIDAGSTFDALDFASAEGQPDKIVAHIVNFREIVLAGEFTVEVWTPYAVNGQTYGRNNGQNMEVGCMAPHSLQRADNGLIWLGQDRNGQGMVYLAHDARPTRVSTFAVEEALKASTDLSQTRITVHQDRGQTFAALNAPGLESTWVLDLSNSQWHERAERDTLTGNLKPWRAKVHCQMHGKTVFGGDDGNLYALDPSSNRNGSDNICRQRTTPHTANPTGSRAFFGRVRLDVTTGESPQGVDPQIEMRYSNDGGFTWNNWQTRSLGPVGHYAKQVTWHRTGSAVDRVWDFRCTSDCKASIVGADIEAQKGLT